MKKSTSRSSSPRSTSSGSRGSSTPSRKSASGRASTTGSRASAPSGRSSSGRGGSTPSSSSRGGSKSAPGTRTKASASSNGRATTSRTSSKGRAAASKASSNGRASTSNRGRSTKQSSPREDLHEVLKDGLKDIYYAEKQLVKALKKVSKAATSMELRDAFDTHRTQTEGHVELLEQAFEALELRAAGKKCPAMDGLIEEANEHIEEMDKGAALDAALIVGAQKIEHYEIAAYGSLRAFAKVLGLSECEQIFDQILQQESETDELLTGVAERVNMEALSGEEEEEARMVNMGEMEEEQM